jgi:hypothetical protein
MSARIRARGLAALALLAAAALALSACGGSDEGATTSAQPGAPDSDAMAEFQSCMEENGASLPDMGSGVAPSGTPPTGAPPTGTDSGQPPQLDEDTQAAMEACSDLMPAAPDGAPGGIPSTGSS